MRLKKIIKESMDGNAIGFEEVLKEELRTRVALALEAKKEKMAEEEDEDEDYEEIEEAAKIWNNMTAKQVAAWLKKNDTESSVSPAFGMQIKAARNALNKYNSKKKINENREIEEAKDTLGAAVGKAEASRQKALKRAAAMVKKGFSHEDAAKNSDVRVQELKKYMSEEMELDEATLKDQLNKHSELAIKYNREGDTEKSKYHQEKMNKIKEKMSKVVREELELDEVSYERDLKDDEPRVVVGVKGMNSKKFSKKFKNQKAMEKWMDSDEFGDYEVHRIMREGVDYETDSDSQLEESLSSVIAMADKMVKGRKAENMSSALKSVISSQYPRETMRKKEKMYQDAMSQVRAMNN